MITITITSRIRIRTETRSRSGLNPSRFLSHSHGAHGDPDRLPVLIVIVILVALWCHAWMMITVLMVILIAHRS